MEMRIRHSVVKRILMVLMIALLLSCGAGTSAYASPFNIETGAGDKHMRITIDVLNDTVACFPKEGDAGGTVLDEVRFFIDGALPYAVSLVTETDAETGNEQVYKNALMVPEVDYDVDGGSPSGGTQHTISIHTGKLGQLQPGRWAAVFHFDSLDSNGSPSYVL